MAEAITTATAPTTTQNMLDESGEPKNMQSSEDRQDSKSKRRSRGGRSASRKSDSDLKTSQSREDRHGRKARPVKFEEGQVNKPKLKYARWRVLQRDFYIRPFEEGDLKFVYADYRLKGGEKMDRDEFNQSFVMQTAHADHIWSVVNEAEKLIGVIYQGGNKRTKETHARWMEWASPRDILTAAIAFWEKMRRKQNILMIVPEDTDRFVERLCRYGIVRRVGKVFKYYPDETDAFVWQSISR